MVATPSKFRECPDVAALLESASRETGLTGFGDPARGVSLRAFISSLREECWQGMTQPARNQAVDYVGHLLGTRLKLIG